MGSDATFYDEAANSIVLSDIAEFFQSSFAAMSEQCLLSEFWKTRQKYQRPSSEVRYLGKIEEWPAKSL
jgi:hypothetical protein